MRSSWKIEKKSGLSYQLLILSGGPYSPNLKLFSVHLKVLFSPPSISLLLFEFIEESEYKPIIERLERFCLLF